jgi:hypothetical protein
MSTDPTPISSVDEDTLAAIKALWEGNDSNAPIPHVALPPDPAPADTQGRLHRAYALTRELAQRCEALYYDQILEPSGELKGQPRTTIEQQIMDLEGDCHEACKPFRDQMIRLNPDGIEGWDRQTACVADAVEFFAGAVLLQMAKLRGEEWPGLDKLRFGAVASKQFGWLMTLVEQEFARLRQALAADGGAETPGKPGRRGYPLDALQYAKKLRAEHPMMKATAIRGECLKHFSEDDLPPDAESFRRWLNRKRANRAN